MPSKPPRLTTYRHPTSFTLQQYAQVLYCQADSLNRMPDARMREALGIFLSLSSKEALALEQIVHIKLLMRCIHKFQKKSEKKGAELMTVY